MAGEGDQIIVRLIADASGVSPGLDSAAAQVAAANELIQRQNAQTARMMQQEGSATTASAEATADAQMQATIQLEEAKLRLRAAMAGNIDTAEGAAAAEGRLDEAYAAGAISANEYASAIARLNVAQEENAASSEMDGAANSGFRFRGLYGTISELGNAFLSAEGVIAAAMAAIGVDALYAQSRIDNLTDAVAATGNASGVSAAEIDHWGAQIGEAVSTADDGQAIFQQLAGSGRLAGTALHEAGDAAVRLAQATGESDSAAANQVLRMDASASAVEKANEQFHFLTAAQLDEVNALFASGNAAEGAGLAFRALDVHLKKNAEQVKQTTSLWQDFKNVVEEVGRAADRPKGGYSLQSQLAHQEANLRREGPGSELHYYAPETEKKIRELQAQINAPVNDAWQAMQADLSSPTSPAALANDTRLIRDHIAAHNLTGATASAYQRSEWEKVLGETTPGTDAYATVWEKLQALDRHTRTAPHHFQMPAGANAGWDVGRMGHYDTGMMGAEAHKIAAQKHAEDVQRAVQSTELQAQAGHQVALQTMKRQHIEALASMGTIGGGAAIEQERQVADAIYKIKLAELEKEKALEATKPEAVARVNSQIIRLTDSHNAELQTLSDKAAAQQIRTSESTVQPILSTFSQVTAGFVEGTLTRQQAELRLGDALVAETINTGMQMLMHHIAIEEAKTIATAVGSAERVALTIAAEAEAAAIHALHAIEWIVTEAAKAAASAFTALAGIPGIGPALAVAASVAAGAEVLSLVGKVASAEGGWDRVPYDGAPAILHKDEMVLPAELAEGVRTMSGGGGNTYHYHIHANDAQGFENMLKRNPGALVRALGHAHRIGATA